MKKHTKRAPQKLAHAVVSHAQERQAYEDEARQVDISVGQEAEPAHCSRCCAENPKHMPSCLGYNFAPPEGWNGENVTARERALVALLSVAKKYIPRDGEIERNLREAIETTTGDFR